MQNELPHEVIESLGRFDPNIHILERFRTLIDANNQENVVERFLKDIEQIIVSNERIFPNEMNALEYAIHNGKYGSAEALINRKKVNINQVDTEGNTPFMLCILSNRYEALDLALKLLEKKCKIATINHYGENALILTCKGANDYFLKIADILLGMDVEQQQFVLDGVGLGGLDYLVNVAHKYLYSEEGVKQDVDLTQTQARELKTFFEDLVVKYFKLYKDRDRESDEVYMRNLFKLCADQKLIRSFSTKLGEIGISLDKFCNRDAVAAVAEVGVQMGKSVPDELQLPSKKSSNRKKPARASLMEPVVAERASSDDSELSVDARAMGYDDEYEYIPPRAEGGKRRKKSQKKRKSNVKTTRRR